MPRAETAAAPPAQQPLLSSTAGAAAAPAGARLCDSLLFTGQTPWEPAPPSATDITPAWLTVCLRNSGFLRGAANVVTGTQIHELTKIDDSSGVEMENGGGKSGTRIVRVELEVSSGGAADLPPCMVHKYCDGEEVVPPSILERVLTYYLDIRVGPMLRQEAVFYATVAGPLRDEAGVITPRCYHAGVCGSYSNALAYICCCFPFTAICCSNRGGVSMRTSLLLEDLGPNTGFDSIHVFSNQPMRCAMLNRF